MYKREHIKTIKNRLKEKRKFIQVIVGPRQVGKTTAIHQVLSDLGTTSHYAAADLPAPPQYSWITTQWELARLKAKEHATVILALDEIQKIDGWAEEVKRLWDEDTRMQTNIKVILLGSSSLLIQKGLGESLAGRFETIRFTHWTFRECAKAFGMSLDEYIYFGGYPGGAQLRQDENRWKQYIRDSLIETAISKDILMLNKVAKPAILRQLFVLACEYGGQILSYQKILGQIQDVGNTTTLAHYKQLLESAFLIQGLEKWSGSKVRQRGSSPKWIPLNTGLMSALLDQSFNQIRQQPEQWGRFVEVTVGAHLINQVDHISTQVYYWRHINYEIDFIVKKGKETVALEVKSGRNKKNIQGFQALKKEAPDCKNILVGPMGISVKDFLQMDVKALFD